LGVVNQEPTGRRAAAEKLKGKKNVGSRNEERDPPNIIKRNKYVKLLSCGRAIFCGKKLGEREKNII